VTNLAGQLAGGPIDRRSADRFKAGQPDAESGDSISAIAALALL
jgi:hypothetical protein